MKFNYRKLQQEKDELQSKFDIANKELNKYKTVVKKSKELEDRKQHDTAKVCSYNPIC